ncbi:acetate/propionate family kinase [[Eubacterium] cellulosolvens]
MKKLSNILCLNSGSSSLKFALYQMGKNQEALLVEGEVKNIGLEKGSLWIKDGEKRNLEDLTITNPNHRLALQEIFTVMKGLNLPRPDAVGHRLVHGGPKHAAPEPVTPELIVTLRNLIPLAPLHLPYGILCIEEVVSQFPEIPQVACFDTAFHRNMPEIAQRLPLPRHFWDEGLRRYGFHGLSYEYILHSLGHNAKRRIIIAHLGNGVSLAAVKDGFPIDTTMGLTPTGGVIMGTRSGDLDPGIPIYLMRQKGYDLDKLDHLLNYESGILGISGLSSDMKKLIQRSGDDSNAAQAIEMFCYYVRKHIGALAAVLGGVDMLIFTGGIGEKSALIRSIICKDLEHLGIRLNSELNEANADVIAIPESRCTVHIIQTKEDLMIARQTHKVISADKMSRN